MDKIIEEAMKKDGQKIGPNMKKVIEADKKMDRAEEALRKEIGLPAKK